MNIIDEYNEPTFGEKFGRAFANVGKSAGVGLPQLLEKIKNKRSEEAELADLQKLAGLENSNIKDKEFIQQILKNKFAKEQGEQEFGQQKELIDLKNKNAPNKFYENLQGKGAENLVNLQQNYLQGQSTMEQLNHLDKLIDETSGPLGTAKGLFSGASAELEAGGTTAIDSILKIFNPTGQMSTEKLKLILATHAPSRYDLASVAKGKVESIRRFTNAAMRRNLAYQELLEKYNGVIPVKEIASFNAQTEKEIDAIDNDMKQESNNKAKKFDI